MELSLAELAEARKATDKVYKNNLPQISILQAIQRNVASRNCEYFLEAIRWLPRGQFRVAKRPQQTFQKPIWLFEATTRKPACVTKRCPPLAPSASTALLASSFPRGPASTAFAWPYSSPAHAVIDRACNLFSCSYQMSLQGTHQGRRTGHGTKFVLCLQAWYALTHATFPAVAVEGACKDS